MEQQLATERERESEVTGTAVEKAQQRIAIRKEELATMISLFRVPRGPSDVCNHSVS